MEDGGIGVRRMILGQLAKGPVYASCAKDFAKELGIDLTQQTLSTAVAVVLDGLKHNGLISHAREPDDPNFDPRLGGRCPLVWAYQLTPKGEEALTKA